MASEIKNQISKLPTVAGVYFFLDKKGKILYIGKATNLRTRVRSYLDQSISEKRSPWIAKMVGEAQSIKIQKTDSVLEALILEATLIKKFEPQYNTAEKDQRSWNWVVITEEEFPRVLIIRERELQTKSYKLNASFGPYTNGSQLREALKIVRKIFPFRDKCGPAKYSFEQLSERDRREGEGIFQPACKGLSTAMAGRQKNTPFARRNISRAGCFNYQLGLCPGVCVGAISAKDYKHTIRHIKLFFQGKKKALLTELTREMKKLAQNRDFESAEKLKRQVFALQHINDISLLKSDLKTNDSLLTTFRIEAYDIAHTSGKEMVGVMVVVEEGKPNKQEYRMFKIRHQSGADDTRALREVLERRFKHSEWRRPNLVVVDGGVAQLNTAKEILKNKNLPADEAGIEKLKDTELVSVVKDERHKPREILNIEKLKLAHRKGGEGKVEDLERQILLANSEAHRFAIGFHKKLRSKAFLYPQGR